MGMGSESHAPAALPPGKDPVPILYEARWASGPVWTGAENLSLGSTEVNNAWSHTSILP